MQNLASQPPLKKLQCQHETYIESEILGKSCLESNTKVHDHKVHSFIISNCNKASSSINALMHNGHHHRQT